MAQTSLATQPNVTILTPRAAAAEASKFIPTGRFELLPFWKELNKKEQDRVADAGNGLAAAMIQHGTSNLAIGYNLKVLHKVLEEHEGAFERMIRRFSFSKRTAYRKMSQYEDALQTLDEPILRAAMARGMNLPGSFAKAIDHSPPPRALGNANIDGDQANKYLDKLIVVRRQLRGSENTRRATVKRGTMAAVLQSPRFLLMKNYRSAKNDMRKMSTRERRKFLESLTGMLLSEIGVQSPMTFSPEVAPDDFKQGRGRPRIVQDEDEDE